MTSNKALKWKAISPKEYEYLYGSTNKYLDGYYIISDEPEDPDVPWVIASTKDGIPGFPAETIAQEIVDEHNRAIDEEGSSPPQMNLYFVVTYLALDNKYVAASSFSEAAEVFTKYAKDNTRDKEIMKIELVSRGLLQSGSM